MRLRAKLSEKEFMGQVIDLARLMHWRVAHFRAGMNARGEWSTPVQADGAGFPDLLLVRGDRILGLELKVGRNKPSEAQVAWLDALGEAGVEAFVVRPKDWDAIERLLK